MSQTIAFTIPGAWWISANGSRGTHYAHAAKARNLRHLAKTQALAAIRAGQLTPATRPADVTVTVGYPSNGRADPPNSYGTVKPLIDGCTDAGVFVDDNSHWIPRLTFERDPRTCAKHTHKITITIHERTEQ